MRCTIGLLGLTHLDQHMYDWRAESLVSTRARLASISILCVLFFMLVPQTNVEWECCVTTWF